MSRELRRVPLEFDWPLNKVWEGYISPYHLPPCPTCGPPSIPRSGGLEEAFEAAFGGAEERAGDGLTPEARAIANTFYPHQIGGPNAEALAWHDKIGQAEVDNLIAEGRLRVWRDDKWVGEPRTAAEVNAGQHGRSLLNGHDGINRWILVEFRCRVLGVTHDCPSCEGTGINATAEEQKAAEEWEGTPPPTGEGWQIWETVSEGSPITPVFPTNEALVVWMLSDHPEHHWRAMSRPGAEAFIKAGWVISGIGTQEHGFESGLEHSDRTAMDADR